MAAVIKVLADLEANYGAIKRTPEQQELMVQRWANSLSHMDPETLRNATDIACVKFRFWPNLAEFHSLCVDERKQLRERIEGQPMLGLMPPSECPKARADEIAKQQQLNRLAFGVAATHGR